MSLQRTPVSGAIVKQLLTFSGAFPGAPAPLPVDGDYNFPAAFSPGSTTSTALPDNVLSRAVYGVRLLDPGAVVSITVQNRVAYGLATDQITYKVFKIAADDNGFATPIQLGAPPPAAPDALVVTVLGNSTDAQRGAIAVNNAARGAFAPGDYVYVVGTTVGAGGSLSALPIAVDIQIEFFNTK